MINSPSFKPLSSKERSLTLLRGAVSGIIFFEAACGQSSSGKETGFSGSGIEVTPDSDSTQTGEVEKNTRGSSESTEGSENFDSTEAGMTGNEETSGIHGSSTDESSNSTTTASDTSISESTGISTAVCGNAKIEEGEVCDDGVNDDSYGGCKPDCSSMGPGCGDGEIQYNGQEQKEICDDGNLSNEDDCTNKCELAQCGDGFIQAGVEECDEGFDNSDQGSCTHECKEAKCGDNFIQTGVEVCDDGNNIDEAYGCAAGCKSHDPTFCGDNKKQDAVEHCDGNAGLNGLPPEVDCRKDCKYDFSEIEILYCDGIYSLAGENGCDQADADALCQLQKGNSNAKAELQYNLWLEPQPFPGFSYDIPDGKGVGLGFMTDFGINKKVKILFNVKEAYPNPAKEAIAEVWCYSN